ncbi:MAG: DUF1624 domain-containing protein [Rhizobiaceae bacterium]
MKAKLVTASSQSSSSPPPSSASSRRIVVLDVARGIALVAMAIYHFAWDLEFFGWMAPATTLQGGWLYFARSIATSFLFLVGVSLFLAHGNGIRWPSVWKRLAQVAGAAALISAATWFVPGGFIFFGILHGIALFSLIGLAFLKLPWPAVIAAAAGVFAVEKGFSHEIFALPALWWVGLAPVAPQANDYVPLFPWLTPVLVGIAVAILMGKRGAWESLAEINLPTPLQRPLSFFGRNSLIFYLVHQPILMGMVYLFTTFIAQPDYANGFVAQCQVSCANTRTEQFCKAYCTCMIDDMQREDLLTPFMTRRLSEAQHNRLLEKRDMCVAKQN